MRPEQPSSRMRLAWSFLSSCLSCLQGFPVANIAAPLRLVLSSIWKGRPQRPFCTSPCARPDASPISFPPLAFSKSNHRAGKANGLSMTGRVVFVKGSSQAQRTQSHIYTIPFSYIYVSWKHINAARLYIHHICCAYLPYISECDFHLFL